MNWPHFCQAVPNHATEITYERAGECRVIKATYGTVVSGEQRFPEEFIVNLDELPKINTEPFGICPPGTVKMLEAIENGDGTWTIPFEYRAEGWGDETPRLEP